MITSEKFKHLKARFLGNFKFTNVQMSIKYGELWIKCIY